MKDKTDLDLSWDNFELIKIRKREQLYNEGIRSEIKYTTINLILQSVILTISKDTCGRSLMEKRLKIITSLSLIVPDLCMTEKIIYLTVNSTNS